jgi:hypothetical protein
LWVAFLDPSDSYFLLADLVSLHIEHICTFFVTFFSATIDGRDLIFGHKLYIGTPYRGKRFFFIRQIPTFCLPKSGGIIGELMLTVHLVYTVNTKYGLRKVTIVNDIMSSVCLYVSVYNSMMSDFHSNINFQKLLNSHLLLLLLNFV